MPRVCVKKEILRKRKNRQSPTLFCSQLIKIYRIYRFLFLRNNFSKRLTNPIVTRKPPERRNNKYKINPRLSSVVCRTCPGIIIRAIPIIMVMEGGILIFFIIIRKLESKRPFTRHGGALFLNSLQQFFQIL